MEDMKGRWDGLDSKGKAIAVGGLAGILLLIGLLFGSGGPSSTQASDYTTAELREVFRLLREDPECRDTRIAGYFERNHNSLEVWERVVGKPAGVTGRSDRPVWTYRTSDGTVTIGVNVDDHSGDIPFVIAYDNGRASFGLDENGPVDSERLKEQILGIKYRVDPEDGLALKRKLSEKYAREKQERLLADAKEQARSDLERRKDEERRDLEKDQWAADSDYADVRDTLSHGPEKDTFIAQKEHWIERRHPVITEARKRGESRDTVPLPSGDSVVAAIASGDRIPVTQLEGVAVLANAKKNPVTNGEAIEPVADDSSGGETTDAPSLPKRVPIHRVRNGQRHVFYADDPEDLKRLLRANPSWKLDGVLAYGLAQEVEGSAPLYRYSRFQYGRQVYSYLVEGQSVYEGFKTRERVLWIWKKQQAGTVPLYLLGLTKGDTRTLVVGEEERDRLKNNGWHLNRHLGYVYPADQEE